jgi:hypothetical protein
MIQVTQKFTNNNPNNPKIHKQGVPIRPIISAIGTYTYKLSKHLDEIIKPILVEDHFLAKDTFDFVNLISEQK